MEGLDCLVVAAPIGLAAPRRVAADDQSLIVALARRTARDGYKNRLRRPMPTNEPCELLCQSSLDDSPSTQTFLKLGEPSLLLGGLIAEKGAKAVDQAVVQFDADLALRQALAKGQDRLARLDCLWRLVVDRRCERLFPRIRPRMLILSQRHGGPQFQFRRGERLVACHHCGEMRQGVGKALQRLASDGALVARPRSPSWVPLQTSMFGGVPV